MSANILRQSIRKKEWNHDAKDGPAYADASEGLPPTPRRTRVDEVRVVECTCCSLVEDNLNDFHVSNYVAGEVWFVKCICCSSLMALRAVVEEVVVPRGVLLWLGQAMIRARTMSSLFSSRNAPLQITLYTQWITVGLSDH